MDRPVSVQFVNNRDTLSSAPRRCLLRFLFIWGISKHLVFSRFVVLELCHQTHGLCTRSDVEASRLPQKTKTSHPPGGCTRKYSRDSYLLQDRFCSWLCLFSFAGVHAVYSTGTEGVFRRAVSSDAALGGG